MHFDFIPKKHRFTAALPMPLHLARGCSCIDIISEFLIDALRISLLLFGVYKSFLMGRAARYDDCSEILIYCTLIKRIFELTACRQIKEEICVVSVGTNGNEL
ncbi:hypothetical protein F2P81_016345 [Scophthalmus maximus]|uniref:Uncharacterized protein n=1 Tax=Scophthalmus maximus TaxID=52904 RepID=A0A6A4SIR7_SCOMX|nr:hypothetical protein F2P81_016345 [Scophthalmus maximus]